jgi:hypothetical protein
MKLEVIYTFGSGPQLTGTNPFVMPILERKDTLVEFITEELEPEKKQDLIKCSCCVMGQADFQRENAGKVIKPGMLVKLGVTDGKNIEHMWFEVIGPIYKDGHVGTTTDKYTGRLDNDPFFVKGIKLNEEKEFEFKDVEQLIPMT